jgi:hypothetical protein
MVFQQWENGERLLNSDKGKRCGVADSGVSAMGKVKKCLTVVFHQWESLSLYEVGSSFTSGLCFDQESAKIDCNMVFIDRDY